MRSRRGEAEVLEVKSRTHQELFTKIADGDQTTEAAINFMSRPAVKK